MQHSRHTMRAASLIPFTRGGRIKYTLDPVDFLIGELFSESILCSDAAGAAMG
jgi:hypothetical protein